MAKYQADQTTVDTAKDIDHVTFLRQRNPDSSVVHYVSFGRVGGRHTPNVKLSDIGASPAELAAFRTVVRKALEQALANSPNHSEV